MSKYSMPAAALAVAFVGCAGPRYVFVPQENATATMAGEPAAYYQLPASGPQGDVELASFGIQSSASGSPAMHVRMIVSNDSNGSWTVDTRRQFAIVPGVGWIRPMWAGSSVPQPPRISIAPAQQATVDLLYPLPPGERKASELPAFSFVWRVQTNVGPVSARTRFNRYRVEPVAAYGPGGRPYDWYDADFYGPWFDEPLGVDDDFGDDY